MAAAMSGSTILIYYPPVLLLFRDVFLCSLFGSADGHVYSLRASDGQLAWRYRAAPEDLRMMVFEQVAADLQRLYGVSAEAVVCDAHTGYTTHRWAKRQALPVEMELREWEHPGSVAELQRRIP